MMLIRINEDADLFKIRKRLPWPFDDSVRFISRDGHPAVAVNYEGKCVAGIICPDVRLQRAADNICTKVLIDWEDRFTECQAERVRG